MNFHPVNEPLTPPPYAELHCLSNFSFLRGASRPEELVETAVALGYRALAITDECSMAGVVRAWGRLKALRDGPPGEGHDTIGADGGPAELVAAARTFRLLIGTELALGDGCRLVALARHAEGYARLCRLISSARRQAPKGEYRLDDTLIEQAGLEDCVLILVPPYFPPTAAADSVHRPPGAPVPEAPPSLDQRLAWFAGLGPHRALALELHYSQYDQRHQHWLLGVAERFALPVVAAGDVHMHCRQRRALQDVLSCIRHGCTLDNAGRRLFANGERHLRERRTLASLYPEQAMLNSVALAERCTFELDELSYRYPREVVPAGHTPIGWLRELVRRGLKRRWPDGVSDGVQAQLEHELELIETMQYEAYFLTVYDIVAFARDRGILCQGRGSAANSAVCYVLGITEVDPSRSRLLFERFISKERNEPPDIDVDFEHERREEVIQYIYGKYGRHRAALAATVISYRKRSAVRDVGKAVGLSAEQIDTLSKSLAWWDNDGMIDKRLAEIGFDPEHPTLRRFTWLLKQILGFPRHLSQHVGGFVIADEDLSTLVPVENAAMPDRTVIQWDKDDLEELGLMKVDVLALGMLTAISKCFSAIERFHAEHWTMATIPPDDTATYDMICRADTIGVFQIESRAQMSMLPRLRPRNFYDLVIEVAIVRPGPIQGGMVNPYLQRRQGLSPVSYPNRDLEAVLKRTLGVPVFQEQVMEIAMVAAGFSAGDADRLRRSMAAWRRVGAVSRFRDPLIAGMLKKGYELEFAESVFRQVEGFGEYGFPESHAASFALLVYVSAWLKCHYPAAFVCAMMNSQPLGFYDNSTLTQDARRHGVKILPVDINASDRDHQLVAVEGTDNPGVQLGFRLVHGLSSSAIERVLEARERGGPYRNAEDLVHRTRIGRVDQQALAIAGALESVSGHRHQAQWELLGVETLPPLLESAAIHEPQLELPLPTEGENLVADYMSTGLTLARHPLALLRERLSALRIVNSRDWAGWTNGRRARLAGIVKVRQRPASAKGVLFMTLEDEHGPINVIVWQGVLERYRREILGGSLLCVNGKTQHEQGVLHLVAHRVEDLSWMLGQLDTRARNFR